MSKELYTVIPAFSPKIIKFDNLKDDFTKEFNLTEKGNLKSGCQHNLDIILRRDPDFRSKFFYNERLLCVEIDEIPMTDIDAVRISCEIAKKYQLSYTFNAIESHITRIAKDYNSYDPIIDYLESLEWDLVPRIQTFLPAILSCEENELNKEYLLRFMISVVARALDPGCKVDSMLILSGKQGIRKSTFFQVLFGGEEHFSDQVHDINNKDTSALLSKKWCIEIAELDAFFRREATEIKTWLSRCVEEYRPAYGRNIVHEPRRCVIVGTTNQTDWMKDHTGARRFWSIECRDSISIDALFQIRDQLFAESVFYYKKNIPWHLSKEMENMAKEQQKELLEDDPWKENIVYYLNTYEIGEYIKITDILSSVLSIELKDHRKHTKAVANILRSSGWKKTTRREVTNVFSCWVREE